MHGTLSINYANIVQCKIFKDAIQENPNSQWMCNKNGNENFKLLSKHPISLTFFKLNV